jgi:hypothetical protein
MILISVQSAGIATIQNDRIHIHRDEGELRDLEQPLAQLELS